MFLSERLPYADTGYFSAIVKDYLSGADGLRPFYRHPANMPGIQAAIDARRQFHTDRTLLVNELRKQYAGLTLTPEVEANLSLLENPLSFTVTTAHQPNLFTGPLYFIYKILHTIRLARELKTELPQYDFIPVYYMGSEDADFAELNHTWVFGKKIEWKKAQGGAVGRMEVDASLGKLIDELAGQLLVEPHGAEVIGMLRDAYTPGTTIEQATLRLVHQLYGKYGLIVLIPDNAAFKARVREVFHEDLFRHTPSALVQETSGRLESLYHSQAHARDINLFYLIDHIRERIVWEHGVYKVLNTEFSFTPEALKKELEEHPERFSPNVILRGILQETILPNIAFIGGGGELAYWLQLGKVFDHFKVPYPVLVLRNSFLVMDRRSRELQERLALSTKELFIKGDALLAHFVKQRSADALSLSKELDDAQALYDALVQRAGDIDPTLTRHAEALKQQFLKKLHALEGKMLRAEKKKFEVQKEQIVKLQAALFPQQNLQERIENISGFYARLGAGFIDALLEHSLGLEQAFVILKA